MRGLPSPRESCYGRAMSGLLRCLGLVCLALVAGCSATQPVAAVGGASGPFEPVPSPYLSRPPAPSTTGSLEIPFLPKAPPGTGAVPVSNSLFRGSLVTGLKESF